MFQIRFVVLLCFLCFGHQELSVLAQEATPGSEITITEAISPVELYDLLLATPFPNDLLPPAVSPLDAYEWRDSNDADLAGAIGGIIFSDGDPFGSDPPTALTYVVYPDASGAGAMLDSILQIGEPTEIVLDDRTIPAVRADLEGAIGLFTTVDNVLIYGLAADNADADDLTQSLAQTGVAHLLSLTGAGPTDAATPVSGSTGAGNDAFLALASAPFPTDDLPFAVGSLVVLPMTVTRADTERDLINALLVRDAERDYPYPLVFYEFYADDNAAKDAIAAEMQSAGPAAIGELTSDLERSYQAALIDYPSGATRVLVQVGATVVIGDAPVGETVERHEIASELAKIAVVHLAEVLG